MSSFRAREQLFQHLVPFVTLVVLCLGFGFSQSQFRSGANIQAILEAAAVPLILATGETFVILLGSIDLCVEGIMGAVCMSVVLLVKNNVNDHDLGFMGIALAVLIGMSFGLVNGILNVYAKLPSLIATVGTWFIALGYAYIVFPSHQPGLQYEPLSKLVLTRWAGLNLTVYLAVGIILAASFICKYTKLGRVIYAMGGDEQLASANGLPVTSYRVLAFVIASALFAVAGIVAAAQLENGNPNVGRDMLFPTIGAAVIGGTQLSGGRGGPLHSSAGVLILTVLSNGMIHLGVSPYTRKVVVGTMIVGAVTIGNWHLRRKLRVVK